MKRYTRVLSSTTVDAHGDQATVEALRDAAQTANGFYIPLNLQHDPRVPPVGRVVASSVRRAAQGHYEMIGEMELWDGTDTPESISGDGRSLKVPSSPDHAFDVHVDLGAQEALGEDFLQELAGLAEPDARPKYSAKKSLDLDAVLLIAIGTFPFREIGNGFFERLGADLYESLKRKLVEGLSRKKGPRSIAIVIQAGVRIGARTVVLDVIASNVRSQDITTIFDKGLASADEICSREFAIDHDSVRAAIEITNGKAAFLFRVRGDGVPSPLIHLPAEKFLSMGMSVGATVDAEDVEDLGSNT